MEDVFKTIAAPAEGIYKAKGSKFLAFAYEVHDEPFIKEQLSLIKKKFHDARHHCYAWRLGPDKIRYRINDDGEPSGTAGKPIYGQILSRDLTDVLVVVVRYFGGTRLGASGLIRAYRSAAAEALDASRIVECKVYDRLHLEFSYEKMNAVMKLVKDQQLELEEQNFHMDCSLILKCWSRNTSQVLDIFSKLKGCRIKLIEE